MGLSKEDKDFVAIFGTNVRRIRMSKNMSMEDLAFASDMEYSQISRIERGIINTKISTANNIAKSLEIPVKDLFDFDNSK